MTDRSIEGWLPPRTLARRTPLLTLPWLPVRAAWRPLRRSYARARRRSSSPSTCTPTRPSRCAQSQGWGGVSVATLHAGAGDRRAARRPRVAEGHLRLEGARRLHHHQPPAGPQREPLSHCCCAKLACLTRRGRRATSTPTPRSARPSRDLTPTRSCTSPSSRASGSAPSAPARTSSPTSPAAASTSWTSPTPPRRSRRARASGGTSAR